MVGFLFQMFRMKVTLVISDEVKKKKILLIMKLYMLRNIYF